MDALVHRAPWYVAGPLIGILIVILRALVNKPLGALLHARSCPETRSGGTS
jgi:hypothetical protein